MRKIIILIIIIFVAAIFGIGKYLFADAKMKSNQVMAQAANSEWPQLQYDSQHKGRTSVSAAPPYKLTWAWMDKNHVVKSFVSASGKNITDGFESGYKFTIVFAKQMQPVIAEGKVYFGALNGVLYAVDALTGDNRWDFTTGGPILNSVAYGSGRVIVASMDGKIYGLNSSDGTKVWEYQTAVGINAAPVIHNSTVYIGSRDGKFYAFDLANGTLKWTYSTRVEPIGAVSPFNLAPIVAPAAVSEDGSSVFFGAENMYFYGLSTANGQEKWPPKKLVGQSFLYGWPVVIGNRVIIRTMSSLSGAEFLMESVLDGLCPSGVAPPCRDYDPSWTAEKSAIINWLTQNPHQKTMYVFDTVTGNEPYQVAMGRVSGNNFTPHLPVLDNQNRLLTYWRSKFATFVTNSDCFGTKYCPDISVLDLSTGDRQKIINPNNIKLGPELDNGFQLSVGGDYLYLANHFRGVHSIKFSNGQLTRITAQSAKWDCGDFRGWGVQIIYYGNDSQPSCTRTDGRPAKIYDNTDGFTPVAIAQTNGRTLLYVNEGDAGFIAAIEQGL